MATGCDATACVRLLDALDVLPRAAWLDLGRRVTALHASLAARRAAASATLDAVLRTRGLAVTAWLVGDAVETAVHLAPRDGRSDAWRGAPRPDTADERAWLAAARQAAVGAALGRLLAPWLSRADVAALIAPLRSVTGARRARATHGARSAAGLLSLA